MVGEAGLDLIRWMIASVYTRSTCCTCFLASNVVCTVGVSVGLSLYLSAQQCTAAASCLERNCSNIGVPQHPGVVFGVAELGGLLGTDVLVLICSCWHQIHDVGAYLLHMCVCVQCICAYTVQHLDLELTHLEL